MTDTERTELDTWLNAIKEKQPAGTMAMVVYVRDGNVTLWDQGIKEFPTLDILAARDMIDALLDDTLARNIEQNESGE